MRRQSFSLQKAGQLQWLQCDTLANKNWLLHAFSTRVGGSSWLGRYRAGQLNLGFIDSDKKSNVKTNRERFLNAVGGKDISREDLSLYEWPLAELQQFHSTDVFTVGSPSGPTIDYYPSGSVQVGPRFQSPPPGDALITAESGILLSVRSADCMPILIADTKRRIVAAVHAGWRGALAGIVEKTVGEMVRDFGAQPADITAAIGPSIRTCCYEVGDEVVDAFCGKYPEGEKFFHAAPENQSEIELSQKYPMLFLNRRPPGHGPEPGEKKHLDLTAVARYQFLRAGLKPSRIQVTDYCTACRTDLFFSHRKEGEGTGRAMAVIGIG